MMKINPLQKAQKASLVFSFLLMLLVVDVANAQHSVHFYFSSSTSLGTEGCRSSGVVKVGDTSFSFDYVGTAFDTVYNLSSYTYPITVTGSYTTTCTNQDANGNIPVTGNVEGGSIDGTINSECILVYLTVTSSEEGSNDTNSGKSLYAGGRMKLVPQAYDSPELKVSGTPIDTTNNKFCETEVVNASTTTIDGSYAWQVSRTTGTTGWSTIAGKNAKEVSLSAEDLFTALNEQGEKYNSNYYIRVSSPSCIAERASEVVGPVIFFPAAPEPAIPVLTPPSCFGGGDGKIVIDTISGNSDTYYVTVAPYYTNTALCDDASDVESIMFWDGTDSTAVKVCNPIYTYNFTYEPAVDGPLVITQGTETLENEKGNPDSEKVPATISHLPAGYYRITIENAINHENKVGCFYAYDFYLADPPQLAFTATPQPSTYQMEDGSWNNLRCEGDLGYLDVWAGGGSGADYGFELKKSGTTTLLEGLVVSLTDSNTNKYRISGIPEGTFVLSLLNELPNDTCRLEYGTAITFTAPDPLVFEASYSLDSCRIYYKVEKKAGSGLGSGNYTYSLTNGEDTNISANFLWQQDSVFCFDRYLSTKPEFEVKDEIPACIFAVDTANTSPPKLENPNVTIDSLVSPRCVGDENGEVWFTVSGEAPFHLAIFRGNETSPIDTKEGTDTTYTFGGLAANIAYKIEVINGYGCFTTSNVFTLSDPEPVQLAIGTYYYSHFGDNTANMPFSVSGGTPYPDNVYEFELYKNGALQYKTVEGSVDNLFYSGLEPDTYKIKANDSFGCADSVEISVTPWEYLQNIDSTRARCLGEANGTISFKVNWTSSIDYTLYLNGAELSTDRYEEFADSTYTIYGLSAGTYQLKVAESNNPDNSYTYADVIVIGEPDPITATIEMRPVNCWQESIGSRLKLTNLGGGNAPVADWSYAWYRVENDTLAGQVGTGIEITDIPAGDYMVLITDALGCEEYKEATVGEPAKLSFSADPITQSCEAVKDGRIDLAHSIDQPFYRLFNAEGHQVDSLSETPWYFDSLAAGDYRLELEDLVKGCMANTTVTIGVYTLSLSIDTVLQVGCYGDSTGLIQATLSGGAPSFTPTYSLYNLQTEETTHFAGEAYGLPAGFYQVTATANEGCFVISDTIEITQPDELIITATEEKPAYCDNANGKVAASISGGTEPYTIEWSVVGEGPAPDPNALAAGTYQVLLTDAVGCIARDTVVVRNLVSDIQLTTSTTDYICATEGGSLTMTLQGEAAPFSLALLQTGSNDTLRLFEGIAADAPFTANGLEDGTYTLQLRDSNGCTLIRQETVAYNPIVVSMAATEESTCGQANGSYTIGIAGGEAPYSWIWSPNVTEAEGLEARSLHADSTYYVNVSDASGCISHYVFDVGNLNGPEISLLSTDSSYCAQPTGSAMVAGSGGNGALTYLWTLDNGESYTSGQVTSIDTLRVNTYRVRVRDETGCLSASIRFTIYDEPDPVLNLSLLDSAACSQPLGRAEAAMSGGEGPYTYAWYTTENELVATTALAEGLLAGQYRVEGTDSRGCMQSAGIYIPEKANPEIWERATEDASCGLATGWAEVASRGGTGTHSYVWQDGLGNQLAATTAKAEALLSGTYTVYAVDANGCTSASLDIVIGEKSGLAIYLAASQPASCAESADGELEVVVEGGTAPYTYLWDDASAQTTARAIGLAAGTYTVQVKDALGCSQSRSLEVNAPTALSIASWSVELPACTGEANGSLSARVEGGTAPYTYAWYTSEGALLEGQASATAKGLEAGMYILTVSDSKGCMYSENVELPDRERVTTTGIPSGAVICNGQIYVLDAGSGWASYRWSSALGFSSTAQKVSLTHAGTYFLEAVNHRGCVVQDTFLLEVSNDALKADFLMASKGYVGDTLVLIDISWPLPTAVRWHYQQEEGYEVITNEDFIQELVFSEPGTYTIELEAFLAECRSAISKQIVIEEAGAAPPDEGGRMNSRDIIYAAKLYPNPNRGRFKVEVELAETSSLRLEVLSIYTSEILHSVPFENKRKVEVPMDLSGMKEGLYLLRIVAGDSYRIIRFYIQH